MNALTQAFETVIKNKTYSNTTPPTEDALVALKEVLLQRSFTDNVALDSFISKALELELVPYFKRDGRDVKNDNYKQGDLIGIYFARKVTLPIEGKIRPSSLYGGFDLTEGTINIQMFSPKSPEQNNTSWRNVKSLAAKYGLQSQLVRGSLRVPLNHEKCAEIIQSSFQYLD